MYQGVMYYQWQRCWAVNGQFPFSIYLNINISRLTQVKNAGREVWHTIFTTYVLSKGRVLHWIMLLIKEYFYKKLNESEKYQYPLILFSHKTSHYLYVFFSLAARKVFVLGKIISVQCELFTYLSGVYFTAVHQAVKKLNLTSVIK